MLSSSSNNSADSPTQASSPVASPKSKRFTRTSRKFSNRRMRVRSIDNMDSIEDIHISEIFNTNLSTINETNSPNNASASPSPKSNNRTTNYVSFNNTIIQNGKIEREREIFLRAALQLLQQDSRNDHIDHSNNQHINNIKNENKKNYHRYITTDVIRYGRLRKISRNNTFSSIKSQYKYKYIELRFGKFTYEDDSSHHLPWNNQNNNSDNNYHNRKTIILSIDRCICQPIQIKSNINNCVFELTELGGPRRLWMASSENERDLWVSSIRNAMIGSVDESLGLLDQYLKRHSLDNMSIQQDNNSISSKSGTMDENFYNNKQISYEGPAASFAMDIAKFVTLQEAIKDAKNMKTYIEIINKLYNRNIEITVPVFYIKCHASSSNFAFSTQDTLNRSTLISVETSQIWKDLQRDNIVINGEHIRGASGTEAMVGAMMRHILDKVDIIRSTDNNDNNINNSPTIQKVFDRFDITEAQALACARDLLILCNRTQSGGDTYFCVDALLCNKQNDLCIVTPLSFEADPIEIYVDIVEEKSTKMSVNNMTQKYRARSMTEYAKPVDISYDLNEQSNETQILTEERETHLPFKENRLSTLEIIPESIEDNNINLSRNKTMISSDNYMKSTSLFNDQLIINELISDEPIHLQSHSEPVSRKTTSLNHSIDPNLINDINENEKKKNIFQVLKAFSPVNNNIHLMIPFKSYNKKENDKDHLNHESSSEISSSNSSNHNSINITNVNLCIRIEVQVTSRYRICDSNPQDDNSTLGEVIGQFSQIFFIKSGCRGRPVVSDRVVTIAIDKPPTVSM